MRKYIKLTCRDNNHNGLEFKEGLNIDPASHGIYFTDIENWTDWIEYGGKIMYRMWDCEPVGEIIEITIGKYRTKSIILSNHRRIWKDPELQLEAVKSDGILIKHIKKPSKEVQIAAVKEDNDAINFIKKPCIPVPAKIIYPRLTEKGKIFLSEWFKKIEIPIEHIN